MVLVLKKGAIKKDIEAIEKKLYQGKSYCRLQCEKI